MSKVSPTETSFLPNRLPAETSRWSGVTIRDEESGLMLIPVHSLQSSNDNFCARASISKQLLYLAFMLLVKIGIIHRSSSRSEVVISRLGRRLRGRLCWLLKLIRQLLNTLFQSLNIWIRLLLDNNRLSDWCFFLSLFLFSPVNILLKHYRVGCEMCGKLGT